MLVGLGVAGGVVVLSSIPLFLSSAHNKRRAEAALPLQLEGASVPQFPGGPFPTYSAFVLRLRHQPRKRPYLSI